MGDLVDVEPTVKLEAPEKPPMSVDPPRFIIIGAGSRGWAYAEAIVKASNGLVAAVADPIQSKRERLGKKFIWKSDSPSEGQSFADWNEFVDYETERRRKVEAGEKDVPPGVDGAFVCVLDEMHRDVVVALAELRLHIMCEKPLACTLEDCLIMFKALRKLQGKKVFSIGHVLRYSPHNILLRKILVDKKAIGHINSVVHTEPVGWWHYTHSYVRGNWRNFRTTGPSLLTKSCHDIDLIMWLLCSPQVAGHGDPHFPSTISSTGNLQFFKKRRKPREAGDATNCMRCDLGDEGCKYSAKHVYLGSKYKGLGTGNTKWPINVVLHDIEDYQTQSDKETALQKVLEEDYDESTPESEISSRNWFGRCVYESDNNVCDDQFVTITWPDSTRPAKIATFHMVAQTTKQCDRYSNFYGEHGEIYADSSKIVVENFEKKTRETYHPTIEDVGHGGGDLGLTRQFVLACDKMKNHHWPGRSAQDQIIGCTLEEMLRAHAAVFAAEEARQENKVLEWRNWWDTAVLDALAAL